MVGRAPPFSAAVSADTALCGRRAALPSLIKTSVCYGFIGLYLLAPSKEKAKASLLSLAMERPMSTTAANSSDPALRNLDALLPDLADLYKDVHSHPELSMQETRTAGLAADHLRAAGFEVTAGVGKTGVVGLLRNGEGPTVMLRADMDALPVREASGVDYASTVTATDAAGNATPVAHACGHDMHVAWLMGVTSLFSQRRTTWRGTIMA